MRRRLDSDDEILKELKRVFGEENVVKEWDVAKESKDAYTREIYCPRIDYAIKPLNIDENVNRNKELIKRAYKKYENLLRKLLNDETRFKKISLNENPRCFLAVEVEGKTSRKHRLGSLINASVLGGIGIIVALDENVLQSFTKISKYLKYLYEHQKIRCIQENIIITTKENFLKNLRKFNNFHKV